MKKTTLTVLAAVAIGAVLAIGAPSAALADDGTGWTYSTAVDCTPTEGSPAVEYAPAVYGEAPLISEAVYVTEYEFAFKKDHPNSPRWESDPNWNADGNPQSEGWHSTGNTREVLVSEAVYGDPPLVTEEVLAQDAVEADDCQIATARWILPNGGTPDNVTWPQALATAAALDAIECGQTVTIQVDDYPYGTAAEKARTDALGDVLEQGEDYGWAFNWRFETFTSEDCVVVPPKPEQQVETREASSLNCDTDTVTTTTEGRSTGEPTYDAQTNAWTQGEWSEWQAIDSKVREATDEECPPPPTEPEPPVEEPEQPAAAPEPPQARLAATGSTIPVGLFASALVLILAGGATFATRARRH